MANHYIKLLLKELGKRYNIPFPYLERIWCWEIPLLLKEKKINEKKIKERLKKQAGFMDSEHEKNVTIVEKEFEKKIKPILERSVDKKTREVKGLSVNVGKGKVMGKVRILFDPRNLNKMKRGEILFAPMTSPEYILAMRKASAIVTDTGGMTCHAAIVSRELGIPCIVGTKIATKIFKNGMKVEVDTIKGTVRMLD
jgi:phosphoenolpyruvate synthase/pyruvate phosphate dikinase